MAKHVERIRRRKRLANLAALGPEARDPGALPLTVELCGRIIDNGMPCYGVLYRPQTGLAYCYKCGATGDHADESKRPRPVTYVRTDKMSEAVATGLALIAEAK